MAVFLSLITVLGHNFAIAFGHASAICQVDTKIDIDDLFHAYEIN